MVLALALALAASLGSAAVEKVSKLPMWCGVVCGAAQCSCLICYGLFPPRTNLIISSLRWLHLLFGYVSLSLQWEVKNGSVGRATIRISSQSWSGFQRTMASCMARLHSAQSMLW
jgi:hypothetical protein